MQISQPDPETRVEIERANAAVSRRAQDWYGKKLKGKPEDLDLMQRMFDDGRVGLAHIHEVLEMGMAFGAVLAKAQKWSWVLVELDGGEQQLRLQPRPAAADAEPELIDPLRIILDPVEAGRPIRIRDLYDSVAGRFPKG